MVWEVLGSSKKQVGGLWDECQGRGRGPKKLFLEFSRRVKRGGVTLLGGRTTFGG
jgi:hypothetical protein